MVDWDRGRTNIKIMGQEMNGSTEVRRTARIAQTIHNRLVSGRNGLESKWKLQNDLTEGLKL
jgi:hypothetical protein